MGLNFNGNPPAFGGKIVAEVPTPTYSGKKSSDPDDSINPYTTDGPGEGGGGLTETEIDDIQSGGSGAASTIWNSLGLNAFYALSNSDLTVSHNGNFGGVQSVSSVTSGKYYWELDFESGSPNWLIGISESDLNLGVEIWQGVQNKVFIFGGNGNRYINGAAPIAYGSAVGAGSIVGLALDMDNGALWYSDDGVWMNSATIGEIEAGTTTNACATGLVGGDYFATVGDGSSSNIWQITANFGQNAFTHTVPTGFTAGFG